MATAEAAAAAPGEGDTITFNLRCHCGTANYSCTLPRAGLPVPAIFCHCSDCRYSTGQLFGDLVVFEACGAPIPAPDVSCLTAYVISSRSTRYFCPRCGAGAYIKDDQEIEFNAGLLDKTQGVLDRSQLFVGPTIDGGAAVWVPKQIAGRAIERYLGHRTGGEVSDELLARMMNVLSPVASMDKLPAICHCGAVKFYITRPPKVDPSAPQTARTRAYEKGLYDTSLCMCKSCALCSGMTIIAWASVPASNIFQANGTPYDVNNPALAHYESSPGVHRDFCKTCGAIVFFRKDSRDPQVYDVGVGLFRDITVRVEGWLEWQQTVDFTEDATDQDLAQALMKNS